MMERSDEQQNERKHCQEGDSWPPSCLPCENQTGPENDRHPMGPRETDNGARKVQQSREASCLLASPGAVDEHVPCPDDLRWIDEPYTLNTPRGIAAYKG